MTRQKRNVAEAEPGDGTFEGARKLYLQRGLQMTLIQRLRAAEELVQTARFVQQAAERRRVKR